ncbi:GtrA family protein [Luteibacter anthropi]|uniref:GtrA family protein n=1 Tax=Luteibacter anthropi TaxID=564369 RepID=UPI002032A556|nr:GtrA family protein [Luteibacter anthropi]URX63032.1 GtrA family protein [Luteibacter anthropi]
MRTPSLIVRYVIFAALSIAVNLGAQLLAKQVYDGPYALLVALIVGTGTGLVTKYILDKRYIFEYQPTSRKDDARAFGLYSAMGIATTCIFWGFEALAHFIKDSTLSTLMGGAIGLIIGYVVKYFLDKHFVFKSKS